MTDKLDIEQMRKDFAELPDPGPDSSMARAVRIVDEHIKNHGLTGNRQALVDAVATELALVQIQAIDTCTAATAHVQTACGYMLGLAINRLRGRRALSEPDHHTNEVVADAIERHGKNFGLFTLDDLHHAPACRANRWDGAMLPSGPCSCGARRALTKRIPT